MSISFWARTRYIPLCLKASSFVPRSIYHTGVPYTRYQVPGNIYSEYGIIYDVLIGVQGGYGRTGTDLVASVPSAEAQLNSTARSRHYPQKKR